MRFALSPKLRAAQSDVPGCSLRVVSAVVLRRLAGKRPQRYAVAFVWAWIVADAVCHRSPVSSGATGRRPSRRPRFNGR